MKKNKIWLIAVIAVIIIGVGTFVGIKCIGKKESPKNDVKPVDASTLDYNERLVRIVNSKEKGNYLISPYSIEIALNMLKEGAKNETRSQVENVIGTREIPVFEVKDRISVTNGAFVKDEFKDYVEKDFYNKLKNYDAELIYDSFNSPDKINDWVNEKTYGMIPKILDDISPDFVLGIANAVAIDVEWSMKWDCSATRSYEFTKTDGSKMNVEMMYTDFENGPEYYFKTDNAEGVVLPYRKYDQSGEAVYDKDGVQLEYVAILPNGTVNEYIDSLKSNQLKEIGNEKDTSEKYELHVRLPRYAYDYKLESFVDVLKEMGIKEAFDREKADFTGIVTKENLRKYNPDAYNVYVNKAVHQTYIDLNEKGTKAAAVTFFGFDAASTAYDPSKHLIKEIVFDKPFIYMIRDSKTKEILFFGVVETPNEWKGSTCEEEE